MLWLISADSRQMRPPPMHSTDSSASSLPGLHPAYLPRLSASSAIVISMLLSVFLLVNSWPPPADGELPDSVIRRISFHGSLRLPSWLTLGDPAQRMRAAGDCMVSAIAVAECVPVLQQALAANSRSTQAALWLAMIAKHEGDTARAQHWLRYAWQRDRSFAVIWTNWQMALAAPGVFVDPTSDEELILKAPAGFRGHFPLLLGRGWDAHALFGLLVRAGHPEQSRGFLQFLIDSKDPKAADVLQTALESGEGVIPHTFPCTAMVRQVVRQGIRGHRQPEGAARLWSLAVGLRSPSCGKASKEVLPDKRSQKGQDPLWNYNPTIRFPLIPESFDWSMAQQEGAFATPDVRGGVRFHLASPSRYPAVLLARPLPPITEESELAITTEWERFSSNACAGSLAWELRDGAGAAIFGRAPLESYPPRPHPFGQAMTEIVNLPLSAEVKGLQLVLVHHPVARPGCPGDSLAVRSVIVQPRRASVGKAHTARN